ncbi:MAG: hypothetical protein ACI9OD_004862 [Limisphaerales bacterium]|jgi:hypothetical protein
MSAVIEIESAIEKLRAHELQELSHWWESHVKSRHLDEASSKAEAIRKTSGCLNVEEGEDFARAVAEAGRDISDSHEW